jgi:hypothetical protein
MSCLIVYGNSYAEAQRLCRSIGRVSPDLEKATPSCPPSHVVAALGIRTLPAVIWVDTWPDRFKVLTQGRAPSSAAISWLGARVWWWGLYFQLSGLRPGDLYRSARRRLRDLRTEGTDARRFPRMW